jgi:HSP20 family protein
MFQHHPVARLEFASVHRLRIQYSTIPVPYSVLHPVLDACLALLRVVCYPMAAEDSRLRPSTPTPGQHFVQCRGGEIGRRRHREDAFLAPWMEPTQLLANPLAMMNQMVRAFDNSLGSVIGRGMPGFTELADVERKLALKPLSVDVAETNKEFQLSVDVPGIDKDSIKIELDEEDGYINISAEKSLEEPRQASEGKQASENQGEGEQKSQDDVKWHRMERAYGRVARSLKLPMNADTSNISAKLENGVLQLCIPKKAESVPSGMKRIEIS